MKKFTRAVAVTTLAAIPVIGFSAVPAGAKTVPPQKWLTQFCTSIGDWQQTISDSSANVSDIVNGGEVADLEGAKSTYVDFLSQSIDATETAIDELKSAGTPKVKNGAKISSTIIQALDYADGLLQAAESDAENISTADSASFISDLTSINDSVSQGFDKAQGDFAKVNKLDTDKVFDKLAKKTKACKALGA
ncbi:MAG: hypothetical protein U0W40_16535 [Acidimicrobiia bacterium]